MTKQTLDSIHHPLFAGLLAADLQHCHFTLKKQVYPSGAMIFALGEQADYICLLCEGLVKVSYVTPNGEESLLDILQAGDLFGDLFIGKYRYRIGYAQAMGTVALYKVSESQLEALLRHHPRVALNLVHYQANARRETITRVHALLQTDSQARLLGILLGLARRLCCLRGDSFILPREITQEDIAKLAGLNRSTVSSLINQFRRYGIMGGRGRQLIVHCALAERFLHQNGFELVY